jgi:hypothetical protein
MGPHCHMHNVKLPCLGVPSSLHGALQGKGISTRTALIHHLKSAHPHDLHKIDTPICHSCNIHDCLSCPCEVFATAKGLANHCLTVHPHLRTHDNLHLFANLIQGSHSPNYNPSWDQALQFIHGNLQPDPGNF